MANLVQLKEEIVPEQTTLQQRLAWIRDVFQIADQPTYDQAGGLAKAAKARWKELEDKRTGITKPLLEAKRNVDALFKPLQDAYLEAETLLKTKIGAYAARVEAERAQAMQRSAEEYAAGGTPTDVIPEPAKTAGVSTKQVWDFTVENPDLVPRELCSPDPEKIRAHIWYADTPKTPPRPVPGLAFVLKNQVMVRTDKVGS